MKYTIEIEIDDSIKNGISKVTALLDSPDIEILNVRRSNTPREADDIIGRVADSMRKWQQ